MSSFSTSQTTSTDRTNCLNNSQVEEIYKGLQQGEYLKQRLEATEETLAEAKEGLVLKDNRINMLEEQVKFNEIIEQTYLTEIALKDSLCTSEKDQLKDILDSTINSHKKELRQAKTTSGLKGGIIGAVITALTIIILN